MKLNETCPFYHLALAAGVVAMGTTASAAADSVADFTRASGSRSDRVRRGRGYDTYAHTVARHIGRYIPGKPSILTRTWMVPGSIVVTNYASAMSRPRTASSALCSV